MTLIMEKLSRYWQLRFLVVGAGIALIVYAALLPDAGNKSRDNSIQSVAAAPSTSASASSGTPVPVVAGSTGVVSVPRETSSSASLPWLGGNADAANQLRLSSGLDDNASLSPDISESARNLRSAAEKGNAVAEFLLGHAYQLVCFGGAVALCRRDSGFFAGL